MERDGKLVFTETKGSSRIVKTHELPILPPLYRSIDAAPSSARNAALSPALPSISKWRCSGGRRQSGPRSTPEKQAVPNSIARRRGCSKDKPATKVSHFFQRWRPVGQ
jgi:hypothetical protein